MLFQRAILSCDDRGTISPLSSSSTYTLGGFASIHEENESLVQAWRKVKQELCGVGDVELKWSHFFPGQHQDPSSNPLLSKDPSEWRVHALWALEEIFRNSTAFPITTIVRKNQLGAYLLTKTPKGKDVIDIGLVFAATLSQFALYLKENRVSQGEIWFDNLGSVPEQERFQESMTSFFESLENSAIPRQNIDLVRRISPNIRFLDSATTVVIQVADFVSGVIWAAAEGDTWFLGKVLENYAPGMQKTYGIVILEE